MSASCYFPAQNARLTGMLTLANIKVQRDNGGRAEILQGPALSSGWWTEKVDLDRG